MRSTTSLLLGLLLVGFASGAAPARAGDALLPGAGTIFQVPVKSMNEIRFQSVVQQRYDFSCGSAAVATLLTYHYDRPTTEDEVFRAMWRVGDQQKIRSEGFSLLDMKRYLATIGHQADGYRVSIDQVNKTYLPGIVLITTKGYHHFVVVSGLELDDRGVMVADPALGLRTMSRAEFEEAWQGGLYFIIRDQTGTAHASFNKDGDWEVQPGLPFQHVMGPAGLAMFTMMLPMQKDF